MTALYIIIPIVLFLLWVFFGKSSYYSKIFEEEHYRAIAQWIVNSMQERTYDEMMAFKSDAGVQVSMTREQEDGKESLHFAICEMRGYTTRAVGDRIAFIIITLLNQNKSKASLYYTESTVHHVALLKEDAADWLLNDVEHVLAAMDSFQHLPFERVSLDQLSD